MEYTIRIMRRTLADIMNDKPRTLLNWWMRENVRVNVLKTVIILFTCKRKGLGELCILKMNY